MCDDLKRDFYAACPVWYWPVLWWQFMLMERHLAELYAARGRGEMTYGLSLGPRGQLRLIFLSDAVRGHALQGQGSAFACFSDYALALICPQAEDRSQATFRGFDALPTCAARTSSHLYLDPG